MNPADFADSPVGRLVRLSVSWPTANKAIQQLVDLGFLREMTGRTYARLYLAPDALRIIQAD